MDSKATSVVIHGVTVMKGDIVRIKFRKLEDVLKDNRQTARINEIMEFYGIDDHTTTLLQGSGHFRVGDVSSAKDGYLRLNKNGSVHSRAAAGTQADALDEFFILDYNNDTWWNLNEIMIEEIAVENEVAETYFSEKHQVSLVIINSTLYLNGQPLTSADSKIFEMFERVMADAALNKLFATDLNNEKLKEF